MSDQRSHTRGKQSTAKKRDSSRHGFGPIPATSKVQGAHGEREKTTRTMQEVMHDFTADPEQSQDLADDESATGSSKVQE